MEYKVAVERGEVHTVDVKDKIVIVVVEKGNARGKVKEGTVMARVAVTIVKVRVVCGMVRLTCVIVMAGVTCGIVLAGMIGGKTTSILPSGSILFILSRLGTHSNHSVTVPYLLGFKRSLPSSFLSHQLPCSNSSLAWLLLPS